MMDDNNIAFNFSSTVDEDIEKAIEKDGFYVESIDNPKAKSHPYDRHAPSHLKLHMNKEKWEETFGVEIEGSRHTSEILIHIPDLPDEDIEK